MTDNEIKTEYRLKLPQNDGGEELSISLKYPVYDTGAKIGNRRIPSPLVLMAHGFASNKARYHYLEMEKACLEAGFAFCRFDFRGHGKSTGQIEKTRLTSGVTDYLNVLAWLAGKGWSEYFAIGSSFGGLVSLAVAVALQQDEASEKGVSPLQSISGSTEKMVKGVIRPRALVLRSTVFDYLEVSRLRNTPEELKQWHEKGYRYHINQDGEKIKIGYGFYEDMVKFSGYELAERLRIPALIIHGGKDKTVPVSQARKAVAKMRDAELQIYAEAGHALKGEHTRADSLEKTVRFLLQ